MASEPFKCVLRYSPEFLILQRFIVVLYYRTSCSTALNESRKELFCHHNRSMDKLPPTTNSFYQHLLRVIYQAGIWTTSENAQQDMPSPESFGWTKVESTYVPMWMTIPEASRACRELIRFSCKGNCSDCKCARSNLDCSPLCKCNCNKQ